MVNLIFVINWEVNYLVCYKVIWLIKDFSLVIISSKFNLKF